MSCDFITFKEKASYMETLLRYDLGSGIVAFSTTRHGGVSEGSYAAFNCTSYTGDDPHHVAENRRRLLTLLPGVKQLVIPRQTHSCHVLEIDDTYLMAMPGERHEMLQGVDALVTRLPHLCLCISTADCIPILLHDSVHGAIGAVHAGWRGTVGRILRQTLRIMHGRYGTMGSDIHAVIAPGISLPAFEVGDEVVEAFREAGFPLEMISEWYPQTHKYHLDLPMANFLQLQEFGVPASQITFSRHCTFSEPDNFFSARRLGIASGRMLSGIAMV